MSVNHDLFLFLTTAEDTELVPYIHLHTDFFTSEEFFSQIKTIFSTTGSRELRGRLASILLRWFSLRFKKDFWKNKELMDKVIAFAEVMDEKLGTNKDGHFSFQNKFKLILLQGVNNIKKSRQERESQYISKEQFITEIVESNTGQDVRLLLVMDCELLADQLLLCDWDFLQSIESYELLSNTWKRIPDSSVRKYVRFFNKFAHFVASLILTEKEADLKEKFVCRFIQLAEDCREKRNYNSLMAILAGLNLHPVSRLRKLWAKIPKRYLDMKEKLDGLMDPRSNYKLYRQALASSNGLFTIPYFGIFLRDLLFIEEGNPAKTETGEMNKERITLLAGVLKDIQAFQRQKAPSGIEKNDIGEFFSKITGCPESVLDSLSFLNEGSRSGSMMLDPDGPPRSTSSSSINSNTTDDGK